MKVCSVVLSFLFKISAIFCGQERISSMPLGIFSILQTFKSALLLRKNPRRLEWRITMPASAANLVNDTDLQLSFYFFFGLFLNSGIDIGILIQKQRVRIHLFQLRLLPWTMFHNLQCTMVNPFEAGSSVLFKFIEIMETICEKAFKRAFKSNGC